MMHRTLVVLLAALTIGLVACAGGPSASDQTPIAEDQPNPPSASPPSKVEPTEPDDTDEDVTSEAELSPLNEILGGVTAGDLDDYNADIARQQRETQAALATCMAEEGFEYVPREQTYKIIGPDTAEITAGGGRLPADAADLSPDERIARYGYGISTVERDGEAGADPADPNRENVDAMTVAERVAYQQALYGSSVALDAEGYVTENPFTDDPAACWNRVPTSEDTPDPLADVRASFEQLRADIAAVRERVATDPRVASATEEWSSCMATEGHSGYDDVNGPRGEVNRRARELGLPGEGVDPNALEDLRAFEISVARADHRCRQGFDEAYSRVQYELEDEFVRTHRAELEQYRDAIAAALTDG